MSLLARVAEIPRHIQYSIYSRQQARFGMDLSLSAAVNQFPDRNDLFGYMHHHFHHLCPAPLRDHRSYFKTVGRGFGEDALHAMWFSLFREHRPVNCLDMGVHSGQIVSLWGVAARLLGYKARIHGVSEFAPTGEEMRAKGAVNDNYQDPDASCRHFELDKVTFVKGRSDEYKVRELVEGKTWDLIFIDDGGDYDILQSDYALAKEQLETGGLLVLNASSLGTGYQPPSFSFSGYHGPSRLMRECAAREMDFVGGVSHNNIFMKRD